MSSGSEQQLESLRYLSDEYTALMTQSARPVRGNDIFMHLPTLLALGSQCNSIAELGVRGIVSSYALALALIYRPPQTAPRRLFMVDIEPPAPENEMRLVDFLSAARDLGLDVTTKWQSDLVVDIPYDFDLTFIDTWHVYGQLKRELAKFAPRTQKFIVMHDTEIDGVHGECARFPPKNIEETVHATGIPQDEFEKGLLLAIQEFLEDTEEGSHWKILSVYPWCNGLTVLERVSTS